jgi:thiol-disulfide isomerase/thioredoxin
MKIILFIVLFLSGLALSAIAEEKKIDPDVKPEQKWEDSDDVNYLPLGILTREQILTLKVFDYNYIEYVPKSDPIQAIHNYTLPAEVKVFFGDWCKDSKKHVPALIKSVEFFDNKNIKVTYINVSRDKKEPADLVAPSNIEKVPTLIVLVDGKEKGRIVETPKASVEQDLIDILNSANP